MLNAGHDQSPGSGGVDGTGAGVHMKEEEAQPEEGEGKAEAGLLAECGISVLQGTLFILVLSKGEFIGSHN